MKRDDVFELCKVACAEESRVDPLTFLALCEQESVSPRKADEYRETAIRLEQAYLYRYVLPVFPHESPLVHCVMATSWGLTQMMGLSLFGAGWFAALDSVSVAMAMDRYIGSPLDQVKCGLRWLVKSWPKSQADPAAALRIALVRYNGSEKYPDLVLSRRKNLVRIYG